MTCAGENEPYDALVIRSATQVTPMSSRRDEPQGGGRAGIGLDNVDVDAATRHGVMVVNAPRSDSDPRRRAHDGAAAGAGTQHPECEQRDPRRPMGPGRMARRRALGKMIGIIGLGRVGTLGRDSAHRSG